MQVTMDSCARVRVRGWRQRQCMLPAVLHSRRARCRAHLAPRAQAQGLVEAGSVLSICCQHLVEHGGQMMRGGAGGLLLQGGPDACLNLLAASIVCRLRSMHESAAASKPSPSPLAALAVITAGGAAERCRFVAASDFLVT